MRVTIISPGKLLTDIIVNDHATEAERFAADELQGYLQKITGLKLKIFSQTSRPDRRGRAIYLTDYATLEQAAPSSKLSAGHDDEFTINVKKDAVIIAGKRPRGVLFGVYDLLETIGCRWISTLSGGEIVPKMTTIALAAGLRRQIPSFKYRGFIGIQDVRDIDWRAKNKSNFCMITSMGAEFDNCQELLQEIKKRDLVVEFGHHSFYYFLPGINQAEERQNKTMATAARLYQRLHLLPKARRNFQCHPDWFAYSYLKKKRLSQYYIGLGQFCIGNRVAIEALIRNIREFFDRYPQVDIVSLWPNDWAQWCECPMCLNRSINSRYLKLANIVARAVKSSHPGKRISIIAYLETIYCPEQAALEDNILIWYAPIYRSYSYALAHQYMAHQYNQAYMDLLQAWLKLAARARNDILLYEYYAGISVDLGLPFPKSRLIRQDLDLYHKLGIQGVLSQFRTWSANSSIADVVNSHTLMRLGWNIHARYDLAKDLKLKEIYGPTRLVRKYAGILEKAMRPMGYFLHFHVDDTDAPLKYQASRKNIIASVTRQVLAAADIVQAHLPREKKVYNFLLKTLKWHKRLYENNVLYQQVYLAESNDRLASLLNTIARQAARSLKSFAPRQRRHWSQELETVKKLQQDVAGLAAANQARNKALKDTVTTPAPREKMVTVDLRPYCNAGYLGKPAEMAREDLFYYGPRHDFRNLLPGKRQNRGILFDIIDPVHNSGHGAIIHNKRAQTKIRLARKARRIYFLIGMNHSASGVEKKGDKIGLIKIIYGNGLSAAIPLYFRINIHYWHEDEAGCDLEKAVCWEKFNDAYMDKQNGLFCFGWNNRNFHENIDYIEFTSDGICPVGLFGVTMAGYPAGLNPHP